MSVLTTAAKTDDKRGGGMVRAKTTQDTDGLQEWRFLSAGTFDFMGQGEIVTTTTESTTPSDTHDDISDNNDDIDMV